MRMRGGSGAGGWFPRVADLLGGGHWEQWGMVALREGVGVAGRTGGMGEATE